MRGPETNARAKRLQWRDRPICGECGHKIRAPRLNDEKRCSRCKEVFDISEFPHNAARADHRESYDRSCKQLMQRISKRRIRGTAQALSEFSPVGEETTTVIGQFVSHAPLTEWRNVPSSVERVQVQYETTGDRKPVYELVLSPAVRPSGTPKDNIRIVHAFKELADAPLEAGQWLACVIQVGELEKVLVAGVEWPLVDTGMEITEDEDAQLGATFGSYAPARPWSLGLALGFILGREPVLDEGCPLCGNEQGEVQDFTLCCPSCTEGLRWSAEILLIVHGEVAEELAYPFLSLLEDRWLLSQIPKEVEVSV